MRRICLFICTILLSGCVTQIGAATPELLVPVSVQNDTFIVERGRVARFDQYRGLVRVESEGLFFSDSALPFGGFAVLSGQEVEEGELLAYLDTTYIEERIEDRRERISDLQAEHNFTNGQFERSISIAQLELLSLTQEINESELPDSRLLESADLKRLELQSLQLDLQQAQDWQSFTLSYYQSDLNDLLSQLPEAELRAPFDGVIVYRADIQQGTRIDLFEPVFYISDMQNLFVEYSGPTVPSIFRTSVVRAVIEGESHDMERIILPPNEVLFFTRAGGLAPFRFKFLQTPGENVQPGQFVQLLVYSAELEDVIRVPPNAVFHDAELGSYVNLIENNQRVVQPIQTGLRTMAWVEVVQGLVEGDEIIVQQ